MNPEEIKDGDPAFPCPFIERDNHHEGMSLRDYFIAHAPENPQGWFKPKLPLKPVPPSSDPPAENEDEERMLRDYLRDPCWDIVKDEVSPKGYAWAESWNSHWAAMREYYHEVKKQTYIQWPAAWADAMLEARKKGGSK